MNRLPLKPLGIALPIAGLLAVFLSKLTALSFILILPAAIIAGFAFGYQKTEKDKWFRFSFIVGLYLLISAILIGLGGKFMNPSLIGFTLLLIPIVPALSEVFKKEGEIPDRVVYAFLIFLGIINPFLAAGVALGYYIGYIRTSDLDHAPQFYSISRPITIYTTIGGILGAFIGLVVVPQLFTGLINLSSSALANRTIISVVSFFIKAPIAFLFYLALGILTAFLFVSWVNKERTIRAEKSRFGTARLAKEKDLLPYFSSSSKNPSKSSELYIGTTNDKKLVYREDGHLITVAGTRAGKGANLIIPNLLGKADFEGSWVVIDPKGESLWYTSDYQRKSGRKVVILNPWKIVVNETDTLNPLDLIKEDPARSSLGDDLRVIAETIVPISQGRGGGNHFDDRARTLIMAMLMHLIVDPLYKDRVTFATLWEWFSDIGEILKEMTGYEEDEKGNLIPPETSPSGNQQIVTNYALQFWQLRRDSEREFGSVVSTAQRYMDIFSSLDLQAVMESTTSQGKPFDLTKLSEEKICLYIVLPPDKLKTHATWLRMMVTSCIRAVLKTEGKGRRVGFILDEFYALGYLRDIDVGMGAYAGYGITLWPILQSMTQLKETYPHSWENFLANAAVTHAFKLNDLTSIDYVSRLAGQKSELTFDRMGRVTGATARALLTPDEVRRGSQDFIFNFIDGKPMAITNFLPWFEDEEPIGIEGNGKPIPFSSRGNPERLAGTSR